ncbi:MAG: response regulator transcription factor [Planctomycetes bacterium]|nr:response regulator transcription factor [Planctomycetota bacterium]
MPSPSASDAGSERALFRTLIALFGLVALLAIGDLLADSDGGSSLGHLVTEGAIVVAGGFGIVAAARHIRRLRTAESQALAEVRSLDERLAAIRIQAERWLRETRELRQGLGLAIDRQLDAWALTRAEKEIALLLLKGLSHKQVAAARSVGEATVRQQARAIYQKANVEGRHDLAAFFLEGMLAPPGGDGPGDG